MDDNVEDIEFDLDEEDGSDNNEAEVDVIDVIESDAGVDDDDDDDDDDDILVFDYSESQPYRMKASTI